jgi:hypothetical protein
LEINEAELFKRAEIKSELSTKDPDRAFFLCEIDIHYEEGSRDARVPLLLWKVIRIVQNNGAHNPKVD